jgi:hypothetical protein
MILRKHKYAARYAIVALVWTIGCDERVVEVAREAADRQAAQNEQMGELQKEVAYGTRSLVEADAAARKEIVGVHRDLQAERRQLGTSWNDLESQRQQVARQRRIESVLVPLAGAVTGVALLVVLLSFLRQLLASSQTTESIDAEFQNLLVEHVLAIEMRSADVIGQGSEARIPIAPTESTATSSTPSKRESGHLHRQ